MSADRRIPQPPEIPMETMAAPGPAPDALDVISPSTKEGADEEDMAAHALKNAQERRRARKRKRIIRMAVIAGVVVVLIGGWAYASMLARQEAERATPITAEVTRGDFSTTVGASGKAEPLSSTVVTPEVDGIIENIQVSEGSTVSVGDVLFTLRNDSLDKAVRDASQQIKSAQSQVNAAQSSLDSAVAAYNSAVNAWNAAPDGETQATMTDPDTLRDPINSAKASLESAQIALQTAQDSYNDAVATAEKRTVKAPCSGSVVAVNAVAGAAWGTASGGSSQSGAGPLVQIADVSQMTVTAQVNEVDISKLAVDQTASVTFSALPGVTMDAKVTHIATVATGATDSSGTGVGGVVAYAVELLIPNPDPSLKPGMTANATITTQSVPDALIVPAAAVTTDEDGNSYVEVATDPTNITSADAFESRKVSVVAQNSTDAAIEGLKEGDVVLVSLSYGPGGTEGDGSGSAAMY